LIRCSPRGERSADHERNEQQESEGEDHADGRQPRADEIPETLAPFRRHIPDLVKPRLELHERGVGTDDECEDADDRRYDARPRTPSMLEDCLYGRRSRRTDEIPDLLENLPARGLLTEEKACNGDRQKKDGRERKHRVERERRTRTGCLMAHPPISGIPHELPDGSRVFGEPWTHVQMQIVHRMCAHVATSVPASRTQHSRGLAGTRRLTAGKARVSGVFSPYCESERPRRQAPARPKCVRGA